MTRKLTPEEEKASQDRYPSASQALRRVAAHGELPQAPVEWLEIQAQANGDLVYRYRLPRALEDDGGFVPAG